jgi:hypothetical protein
MAKKEKLAAEAEMERINAVSSPLSFSYQWTHCQAAESAYAKDVGAGHAAPGRLHPGLISSSFASSSKPREKPKGDKWANYTSAKDLGIEDLDTSQTAYEVEQEIKGRAARDVGKWEEVVETPVQAYTDAEASGTYKRKLGEYGVDDNAAEGEEFKFAHRDKRPLRDPYATDDWDPDAVLGKMKIKTKESGGTASGSGGAFVSKPPPVEFKPAGVDLDREKWTGKLEIRTGSRSPVKPSQEELVYVNGGWNKLEEDEDGGAGVEDAAGEGSASGEAKDVKPDLAVSDAADTKANIPPKDTETTDVKPDLEADISTSQPAAAASSMFKKRRAPPGGRKK